MFIMKIVVKILTTNSKHRSQEGVVGGHFLGRLVISIFEKPCFYIFVLLLLIFLKENIKMPVSSNAF